MWSQVCQLSIEQAIQLLFDDGTPADQLNRMSGV